jgi:hypothetical protein
MMWRFHLHVCPGWLLTASRRAADSSVARVGIILQRMVVSGRFG